MASPLAPIPLLLILVVAAVGAAGWIHSYRWEQEAIAAEQTAAAAVEAARSKKSEARVSVPMPDLEEEGPPQAVVGLELTSEEQVILDLQNQLDRLRSENESLSLQMRELMEPAPEVPEGARLGARKSGPEAGGERSE